MSDSYATEIDLDGLEKVVFDRFTAARRANKCPCYMCAP